VLLLQVEERAKQDPISGGSGGDRCMMHGNANIASDLVADRHRAAEAVRLFAGSRR
jgi:hypothetical protein